MHGYTIKLLLASASAIILTIVIAIASRRMQVEPDKIWTEEFIRENMYWNGGRLVD